MKNDANSFWNRVEEEWSKKNISKTDFCRKGNGAIKFGTWSNKKSLGIMPNLELATAFAEALEVSLDYLVTGKEYKDPFYQELENNLQAKDISCKLLKCNKHQLDLIDSMIDSWGFADTELNKGLA